MEEPERAKILHRAESDWRLRRLYDAHKKIEARLARFSGRRYMTTDEQLEEKTLKFQKLRGVEKMLRILREQGSPSGASVS